MSEGFSFDDESTWHPSDSAEDLASGWFTSKHKADRFKDDEGREIVNILGRFTYHDHIDVVASQKADKEVNKRIIICLTKIRGSNPPDISSHKVNKDNAEHWITRFPEAWKKFMGEKIDITGIPLTEIKGLDAEKIMFLSFDGIRTCEDLATLSDAQCSARGYGYRDFRDKAKELIGEKEEAGRGGDISNLQQQLDELRSQNEDLMRIIQSSQNMPPRTEPEPTAEELELMVEEREPTAEELEPELETTAPKVPLGKVKKK